MKKLMAFLLGGGLLLASAVGHAITSSEAGVGTLRSFAASAGFASEREGSAERRGYILTNSSEVVRITNALVSQSLRYLAFTEEGPDGEITSSLSFSNVEVSQSSGTPPTIELSYEITCFGCPPGTEAKVSQRISQEFARAVSQAESEVGGRYQPSSCNTAAPSLVVLFLAAFFYMVRRVWVGRMSGK